MSHDRCHAHKIPLTESSGEGVQATLADKPPLLPRSEPAEVDPGLYLGNPPLRQLQLEMVPEVDLTQILDLIGLITAQPDHDNVVDVSNVKGMTRRRVIASVKN